MIVAPAASGPVIVFTLYAGIALLALVLMTQLDGLDEKGSWEFDAKALWHEALGTGWMLVSDPLLVLLVPVQVAFGFACSFVNYYVFGTIIADAPQMGSKYIGALSALVCFSGAVIAIPAGWVAKAHGKVGLMVVGGCCLAAVGLGVLLFSDAQLAGWDLILLYLTVYGVGRGIWENTNKAVVADFFSSGQPSQCTCAFAAVAFTSGLSKSVGFFIWPSLPRGLIAVVIVAASVVSIVCYLSAVTLFSVRSRTVQFAPVVYAPI